MKPPIASDDEESPHGKFDQVTVERHEEIAVGRTADPHR